MSVALENARLFDETQRLLKETEQRAAELAIINSVQEGLASKLEMQAIYDLVGDKIREIFAADTAYIAVLDEDAASSSDFPYYMDSGQRLRRPARSRLGRASPRRSSTSRAPLLLNTKAEMAKHDSVTDAYEDASKDLNQSFLGVPVLLGDRVQRRGQRAEPQGQCLRRERCALAADPGQQHERGAGKRPPVR